MLVNSSDFKSRPNQENGEMIQCGVPAVNSAIAARNRLLTTALVTSTRLKPKRARIGARGRLHGDGAHGGGEGEQTRLHRVEAEAELQHQRQQKGERADADAIEKPADHAGEEGMDLEQVEIEQRRGRRARVSHIERAADDARRERRRPPRAEQPLADGGKAEGEPGEADA